MLRATYVTALALILAVAGCASTGDGSRGRDMSVLTEEEIAASATSNAYDLVQSLRPRWLALRGQHRLGTVERESAAGAVEDMQTTTLVVYVDGTRFGELESLRSISTRDIRSMRRLSGPEATRQYGTGHTHGAILVTTR